MSIVDGVLFAILVIFMIVGFTRGLVKEVVSLLLVIVPICLAMVLTPIVSDALSKNTKIEQSIANVLTKRLLQKDDTKLADDRSDALDKKSSDKSDSVKADKKADKKDKKDKEIKEIGDIIVGKSANFLSVYGVKSADRLSQAAISAISTKIVRTLSFILIYIIAYTAIMIIYMGLNLVASIPILAGFNRFFGALLGLLKAVFLISVILLLVPVLYVNFGIGGGLIKAIDGSTVLKSWYDNNIILLIWQKITEH